MGDIPHTTGDSKKSGRPKPPNAGKGRPKGSKNKMTGAHGDLLAAWDAISGPGTAKVLLRAAIQEAEGVEVPIFMKSGDPVMVDGKPAMRTVRDFKPLIGILPYIARKMPDTIELGPIEALDPDEIERLWSKRQDK